MQSSSQKKIGKYTIMRTLGSGGSCKVKLGLDTSTGKKVAVKIMNDDLDSKTQELILAEVQNMQKLAHQNVLRQIEFGTGVYEKSNGKSKTVSYIVLEICGGGELFDFIAISGAFKEPLARYFFKQFMEGLDYCHSNGVAHRDLKPENILLDSNYVLKIADFGFAAPVEGRDGSGYLKTKLGTMNYMAPEIHLKQPYMGKQVDLFASAIILFIMVAQHPPFTTAQKDDPFYKCLAGNRSDIFWKTHCKNKPKQDQYFSQELKELLTCMMQLEPNHRPSMSEVQAHPWMQGPVPTSQQVIDEFQKRQQLLKQQMEQDREQKKIVKEENIQKQRVQHANRSLALMQDGQQIEAQFDPYLTKKAAEPYERLFESKTEFFSTYNPDMIEEHFIKFLTDGGLSYTDSDKKYKIKFTDKGKDELGSNSENEPIDYQIDVCMRISKVNDEKVCVEFTKLSGNQTYFIKHYDNYVNGILKFANDAVFDQ